MIDFLLSVGFRVFKSCNCSGGKAWFKKEGMPGVEIKTFRRTDSYVIYRGKHVINRGMSHQLEVEYQKLFA